ncbi:MAG: DegT/DnrJ/EryC1/StrS family aminotransferase [Gammaproteobacteria bacterium]|nr:DegT/DnrJ/EryC1/StrS family aminotransferase [Gammaproteobacteria bacterium]MCP5135985.1 DegT/DnrJ/EryC1/StrS family aminotransferase [Gammaproteobacteria bacterium]
MDSPDAPIFVTRPFMPPLGEYLPYLEAIWENRILTNRGPYLRQLEEELKLYLGVPHISVLANGTVALMAALATLDIAGEVITTPFTFAATAHALKWCGLTPVFVDVEPDSLTIDPEKIEAAITPRTSAIMAVHCYGYTCDTARIKEIADRHELKVIYDAAHCFGVRDNGGSVLRHGDLSVLSFHATKVFNTFEGGAVVCPSAEIKDHVDRIANFGLNSDGVGTELGLNAKLNEVSAAFGLLQLKYLDQSLASRERIDREYRERFSNAVGIRCLQPRGYDTSNYSYFPIMLHEQCKISSVELSLELNRAGVYARRYFYPLLSEMEPYRSQAEVSTMHGTPVAAVASERVLCLPIYPGLDIENVNAIADVVIRCTQ